jgi:hypothetical protein
MENLIRQLVLPYKKPSFLELTFLNVRKAAINNIE